MVEPEEKIAYHCGHCGAFFTSSLGHSEGRICPSCGESPVVLELSKPKRSLHDFQKLPDIVTTERLKKSRGRMKFDFVYMLVVLWVIGMSSIVAYKIWHIKKSDKEHLDQEAKNIAIKREKDEKISTMVAALPECHRALAGFLQAKGYVNGAKYILNEKELTAKMVTFYSHNPFTEVNVQKLRRIGQALVGEGDQAAIVTRWREEAKQGVEFDVVFRREGETWKLDWEHFSQFSDYPFVRYLAGDGPDVGEFRLLARQRQQTDNSEESDIRLALVLIAPEWGKPQEIGLVAQDLQLDRRSAAGLILEEAFNKRSEAMSVFENSLPIAAPEDLIRVRVSLSRKRVGDDFSFSIERVHACHWVSSDAPGFGLEIRKED